MDINKCIEYIEQNIKEELTPELIVKQMGYSQFHFCRIFAICEGVPLMEYIRKRRLSLAASELFGGKKIIDIALEYGFNTHSGFSKAFKKEFGFTPTQYISRMSGYISNKTILNLGGIIMNSIIVKKPAFKVAGYGINTNVTSGKYTKDIASFWINYEGENLECKMYDTLSPPKHGEVGLCIPADKKSGNATYLLGVIVDDFSKVTSDMITVEVPEATYAVFTTPPVDCTNDESQSEFSKVIKETWKYIFEVWFKDSGYAYDENALDFEFYDERCHWRKDTVMDIYIPIISKQ